MSIPQVLKVVVKLEGLMNWDVLSNERVTSSSWQRFSSGYEAPTRLPSSLPRADGRHLVIKVK